MQAAENNNDVLPTTLPGYRLDAPPRHMGASSVVSRAWDWEKRRRVIIKSQRFPDDPGATERFRREAIVLATLDHPHGLALHKFVPGPTCALVLEEVSGRSVADALAHGRAWSLSRLCTVIEQIAAVLDCAHAQGIVHGDVCPSNLLLPTRGPARLIDWGNARIEGEMEIAPATDSWEWAAYAAPDHETAASLTGRADVYSLATVATALLTGAPPFRAAGESAEARTALRYAHAIAHPPSPRLRRPDLPPGLEKALAKGLAKRPEDRYQSAGQLAAALRAAAEPARQFPALGQTPRPAFSLTRAAPLAAGGLMALLLGAAWVGARLHPAPMNIARPDVQVASRLPAPPVASPPPSAVNVPVISAPSVPPRTAARPETSAAALQGKLAKTVPHPRPSLVHKTPHSTARPAPARAKNAWLQVYAVQRVSPPGQTPHNGLMHARLARLDGKPVPALAAGQWVRVKPGVHEIAFYPKRGSGYGANTNLRIRVQPRAHLRRQIPLPVRLALSTNSD